MLSSDQILRIYPDAHHVEQALMEAAEVRGGFVDASWFLSWGQLVEAFEPTRRLGRRPCTPLTGRVVVWALAQSLPGSPFKEFLEEPAFARAALDLILQLKAGCCSPAEFDKAVAELPDTRRARGAFLSALYRHYQAQLETLRLADREDLLLGALQQLEAHGLPPSLARAEAIEVHALYDFSPLRFRLLDGLARHSHRAGIRLQWEVPASGNERVDAVVDTVLKQVEIRWADLDVDTPKTFVALERPLVPLGGALFLAKPQHPQAAPGLELLGLGSPRDEAREIAHRVRRWVEEGTPPEQIAVAFRDLGEEAELVAEALEDVGIPARIRLGAPLSVTAVGRLALQLPWLVEEEFPAADVTRFLESRYLPEVRCGPADSIAAVLKMASVRDDRIGASPSEGAYAIRLRALQERTRGTRAGEVSKRAAAVAERVGRLMSIARKIPEKASASKLLSSWWEALGELGLTRAVRYGEPRSAEGTLLGREVVRALARDQAAEEALRELLSEFDSALRLSGAAAQVMDRRIFHRWLVDSAADFNLTPKGPRGGAVAVLDVRELVGTRFERVWVGGMLDGRFPGRATPDALFPEEDRLRVNAALKRDVFRLMVGDLERRLPFRPAEDRLLFFHAMAAATRSVCLSFARHGAGGKEQLASPFFDEVRRVTGMGLVHIPIRSVPPVEAVASESELEERVALESLAWAELRSTEPDPAAAALQAAFQHESWFQLANSLKAIEDERLKFFSNPELEPAQFSGRVDAPELASVLRERFRFGADRPLTASHLGRFGNCAFQGFLAFALGLEEPETPGEELDNRRRGSFWHKVLELLMPRLKEEGLLGQPPEELPDSLLDEVLEAAATDFERKDHVGHPALWRLGRDRARAMVRRVLGSEVRGLPFEGQLPEAVERRFGDARAPDGWKEVVLPPVRPDEEPIHFGGKIDRFDSGSGRAGVVDYKTRTLSAGRLRESLLVTEFQLPLYLFAARMSGHQAALQAAWLSLRDGKAVSMEEVLQKAGQTLDELLAVDGARREQAASEERKNFANVVHELVGRLRQGMFPARPQDCRFCAYRPVCRISERRLSENPDG